MKYLEVSELTYFKTVTVSQLCAVRLYSTILGSQIMTELINCNRTSITSPYHDSGVHAYNPSDLGR